MSLRTAEGVWFARLSRALDALPLADPEKVWLVHEIDVRLPLERLERVASQLDRDDDL